MVYEMVALKEISEIVTGSTPSKKNNQFWENGKISFVTPAELEFGKIKYVNESNNYITKEGALVSRVIPSKAILVCCIGSLGKIAISGKSLVTNQQINSVILDEKKVNYKYGFYAISRLRAEMETIAPATTVKIINKTLFSELKIPLPSLDTQVKIANALDKVQELIDKRKEQIAQMDEFLQSLFLDMFGDPVTNPLGWEVKKLSNLGLFKNGMNYKQSESGYPIKFIGVSEFKYTKVLNSSKKLPILELNVEPNVEYLLKNGDIIFVRSNGSKDLVGRSLLINELQENTTYSGFCIRYRNLEACVKPEFLIRLFSNDTFNSYLKKDSRGANINNLNQQILSNLNIIIPPLPLQEEFASIVEKVEAEKEKLQKGLEELENNFNSMMQRAFKGELF